ncbi:hypothetical protein GOODEAATRI_006078 [Goodea atripinnis]|uniref:Uncharacterized protein n=1 Tax=Goodea atripinnis TaxID=208336 RepID=A0ABV0NHU9_9TELE
MQPPSPLITEPQPLQFDDQPPDTTLSPGSSQQHRPVSDPKNTSHFYWLNQLNATQREQPSNSTEITHWKKKNTSQGTQQSPSWLPVLEKHDIPIVVGVGISLAFIFITVTFYSMVQKNEPTPPGRAVIEQSPNTSDTRARPQGPSLVTVQMEPTFEEIQEVSHPTVDHYSVTVETHPEPIVDSKV